MSNNNAWIWIAFFLAGILVGSCLGVAYVEHIESQQQNGNYDDNSYHLGYRDCSDNFNLTSDEQYVLNKYRITKIEEYPSEICTGYLGENGTVIVEKSYLNSNLKGGN